MIVHTKEWLIRAKFFMFVVHIKYVSGCNAVYVSGCNAVIKTIGLFCT
jgi:hypothetical protein